LQGQAETLLVRYVLSVFDFAAAFLNSVVQMLIVPSFLGAALSYVPDGLLDLDDLSVETLAAAQWMEAVSLSIRFSWMVCLQRRGELSLMADPAGHLPPVLGVGIG
jgi:hypothetical protein